MTHERSNAVSDYLNGKTPWEFACAWYTVDQIEYSIKNRWRTLSATMATKIPSDVDSPEFAAWLTEQYRLAMAKGIEIGQRASDQLRASANSEHDHRPFNEAVCGIPGCDCKEFVGEAPAASERVEAKSLFGPSPREWMEEHTTIMPASMFNASKSPEIPGHFSVENKGLTHDLPPEISGAIVAVATPASEGSDLPDEPGAWFRENTPVLITKLGDVLMATFASGHVCTVRGLTVGGWHKVEAVPSSAIAALQAELSTERECRQAAEKYIATIPAMCHGDFSQPCALHVRGPIESLWNELKMWKPLTPEEAEAALAEVQAEPISDETIAAIVAKVTDPAYRPSEPEHVLLAAKVNQQADDLTIARETITRQAKEIEEAKAEADKFAGLYTAAQRFYKVERGIIWNELQRIAPWADSNDMDWIDEIMCGLAGAEQQLTAADARIKELEAERDNERAWRVSSVACSERSEARIKELERVVRESIEIFERVPVDIAGGDDVRRQIRENQIVLKADGLRPKVSE